MKRIIIGNLKMYMTYEEVLKYINEMDGVDVIICPSSIYVSLFLNNSYNVGIQDISMYDLGAHTGDISGVQAKDMGVNYTLIGHSERRKYYQESDEIINKKVVKALECGLKVVLCIGDDLCDDREKKLEKQLLDNFKGIVDFDNIIIVYEPVWCIGTGQTPSNDEIKTTVAFIKTKMSQWFDKNVKVLYGGSVDKGNIDTLLQVENVDGFLIGKASTDSKQFKEIIRKL